MDLQARHDVGCRILVAEDDPALRETLVHMLHSDRHEVIEAEDGEIALELLKVIDFKVLLLDLHMPKVDGLAVLDRINDLARPQVIVYSAFEYYDPESLSERFGDRITAALQKPVHPRVLVSTVEWACAAGSTGVAGA
jgi:two-component system, OmpR family, response regulator